MHVPPQLWVAAFALATALVARLARATTAPRAGGAAGARAHRAWNERMPAVVHAETLVLLRPTRATARGAPPCGACCRARARRCASAC